MHPTISDAFSRARVAELHARADAHRLVSHAERRFSFRYAERRDRPVLERLAVLDGAEPLATPLLVAEIDDVVVAAIGAGGEVIADPFVPTSRLVRTLRGLRGDPAGEAPRGLRGRIRAAFAS
jgi:hypothetical protein